MCDHDCKFGSRFAHVAATTNIKLLRTPYQAPRANAICERFLGSVRRQCLDHFLILHEKQHEPRAKSRMWDTSIGHDHIKASGSNCQSHQRRLLHLNIPMVETISPCAFSVFDKPRSYSHLVIPPQTSMVPNTRGIFRMQLRHQCEDEMFSLFETLFSGLSVNGVKATMSNGTNGYLMSPGQISLRWKHCG